MGAVFERDSFSAAEPLHEQSHGGYVILAIQQRRDDLRKTTRGVKVFDMLPPEGKIAR